MYHGSNKKRRVTETKSFKVEEEQVELAKRPIEQIPLHSIMTLDVHTNYADNRIVSYSEKPESIKIMEREGMGFLCNTESSNLDLEVKKLIFRKENDVTKRVYTSDEMDKNNVEATSNKKKKENVYSDAIVYPVAIDWKKMSRNKSLPTLPSTCLLKDLSFEEEMDLDGLISDLESRVFAGGPRTKKKWISSMISTMGRYCKDCDVILKDIGVSVFHFYSKNYKLFIALHTTQTEKNKHEYKLNNIFFVRPEEDKEKLYT